MRFRTIVLLLASQNVGASIRGGRKVCDSLIQNGDAENAGSLLWIGLNVDVELVPEAGIDNSTALSDREQTSTSDAIAQYLDTRCLEAEKTYEIKAWVKLVDIATQTTYFCNAQQEACPRAGLVLGSQNAGTSTLDDIGTLSWTYAGGHYQLVHGVLTITQEIADAKSVLFFIERNKVGMKMYVDNVSVELMSESCEEIVRNGHFDSGTAMHWQELNGEAYAVVEVAPGTNDYALSTTDGSAMQYVRNDCIEVDKIYEVTLKYKLKDSQGLDFVCSTKCPKVGMTTTQGETQEYKVVAREAGFPGDDGWGLMYGMFKATPLDADPNSKVRIMLTKLINGHELIVDSVSIKEKPEDCTGELTFNSDMELGHLGFWTGYGSGMSSDKFSVYPHEEGNAVRLSNREKGSDGMEYEARYFMDLRCMDAGNQYDVIADFKLLDKVTGDPASCDITNKSWDVACPSVRFYVYDVSDENTIMWNKRVYDGAYKQPWDPNRFNRLHKTITVPSKITEAIKVYVVIRDFSSNYDLIVDQFKLIATQGSTPSPTWSATAVVPTPSPTETVTTQSPTEMIAIPVPENVCPEVGETLDVADPTKDFVVTNDLCTLTKVTTDFLGEVLTVVPVARSYNGNDWESAPGGFAAEHFADTTFACSAGKCTIPLPELEQDEKYILSSFWHQADTNDERARFIEQATFGTTKADLDSWTSPNYASWVRTQMDLPATSLRAYFREWTNPRWQFSQKSGRSNHPCDTNSRWRKFAFTKKDEWDRVDGHAPSGRIYVKPAGSAYVLYMDGHARTVVQDFKWEDASVQSEFSTWDPGHGYKICTRMKEFTGGQFKLETKNGDCMSISTGNPKVDFTGNESYMGNNVFYLTDATTLTVIEAWKYKYSTSNGEMYVLEGALTDSLCDSLPEQAEDLDAPVFMHHPSHGYLQWEPRLKWERNTLDSPMQDGGGSQEIATGGATLCMNAPRTFLNSEHCVLSTEPTACSSNGVADLAIELNSTNVLQLHSLTGRYTYVIDGLKVKDGVWQAPHPCTTNHRSRWIKKTGVCSPTTLSTTTKDILSDLLSSSTDPNPYMRDILFKSGLSCDSADDDSDIEILVGNDCWQHVHPEHMSVWDMTYWTLDDTHPGNEPAKNAGKPNPIKKYLDNNTIMFPYPSWHPMDRWENHHLKFEYVGRFGDSINYRDLPSELRLDQVVDYFGTSVSSEGHAIVVCGSPGEVANDPLKGSDFDLTSIVKRDTTFRGYLMEQREIVWTMVALYEKDQLRQRMAWALSQILAIAKSAIKVHERRTECFLYYYDIFVRRAFGNYLDVLREVSYSALMAENLSFLGSKSSAYVMDKEQRVEFADENYAREIMQLFTTGLVLLNLDGTPKLDSDGNQVKVYTNADIRSISRVWTGFDHQEKRANVEDSQNKIDPMRVDENWHDKFPKSNLAGGFIGDGYPLCVDLPERQFLRKGSRYRLLGSSPLPELMTDNVLLTDRFVLDASSDLYGQLCNGSSGNCQFPMEVKLTNNLNCHLDECNVDTVRAVKLGDNDIFYEYIQPPCVEHSFFDNGMKLNLRRDNDKAICANPNLPAATSACCEQDSWPDAISVNKYHIERMTFATQDARCLALPDNRVSCEYKRVDRYEPYHISDAVYHWAFTPCSIQAKVDPNGEIAIVHDMPLPGAGTRVTHVNDDTMNFFKVEWEGGEYPKQTVGNCGSCQVIGGDSCLCNTTVEEDVVFSSAPPNGGDVLSKLHIGAPDPSSFDGKYTSSAVNGFTVHKSGTGYELDTIFEVTDDVGRTHFLKNAKSTVKVDGNLSFRNPVQFMSLVPSEANIRDITYEVEATLEHLVYHDNTAPFLCRTFIQRFGISNPSPRYVKECSMAFRSGNYESEGVSFGANKYGDLEATAAAILLDREARAVILDVDPSQGSIREPLIRAISLMRNMDFQPEPSTSQMVVFDRMNEKVGQMAFEQESVFNFYLAEFVPDGPVSSASCVAPEAQLLDMPKIVDLINGMHSMIKYGLSACDYGFGFDLVGYTGGCNDDGNYGRATGTLTYQPPQGASSEQVVQELCTLLTSGRLDFKSRQVIIAAYEDAVIQKDTAAGVRIATQLLTTTGEYHTTNTVKFSGKPRPDDTISVPAPGEGYKAVVMLMFAGGCDSYNMLVPSTCSPSQDGTDAYQKYAAARKPVELLQSSLKEIHADGQVNCEKFGVHQELPILQELYEDGDLLFFANTGVLGKPSSKQTYEDDTPVQIFAHNHMQRQVKVADLFNKEVGTGLLGRMANALSFKGLSVGSTSVDGTSSALVGRPGASPPPISISNQGVNRFMPEDSSTMAKSSMLQAIGTLNNDTKADSGFMASTWSSSVIRSLNQNEQLYNTLENTEVNNGFGSSEAGKKLKMVSKLIKTREERGVNVDLFYVQVDGWDHHAGLEEGLTDLFKNVNEALTAFATEMKAQNIWNNVTVVQVSDFGRSMSANTGGGTDHAWGGNYFMTGGAVKGRHILGEYPADMSVTSPLNLGRGRFLPTRGWDEIWPTIAMWAGVDDPDLLDMVCPNRGSFPTPFTMGDLFA